jgi:hypothetical protein
MMAMRRWRCRRHILQYLERPSPCFLRWSPAVSLDVSRPTSVGYWPTVGRHWERPSGLPFAVAYRVIASSLVPAAFGSRPGSALHYVSPCVQFCRMVLSPLQRHLDRLTFGASFSWSSLIYVSVLPGANGVTGGIESPGACAQWPLRPRPSAIFGHIVWPSTTEGPSSTPAAVAWQLFDIVIRGFTARRLTVTPRMLWGTGRGGCKRIWKGHLVGSPRRLEWVLKETRVSGVGALVCVRARACMCVCVCVCACGRASVC